MYAGYESGTVHDLGFEKESSGLLQTVKPEMPGLPEYFKQQ